MREKEVSRYVGHRLLWLQNLPEHPMKAALAHLRRGIGRAPGDLPELWGVFLQDMPIEFQAQMTSLLDTSRQIGLSLTDSYILTPRKSVTALVGITDLPRTQKSSRGCGSKCASCKHIGCAFRKKEQS